MHLTPQQAERLLNIAREAIREQLEGVPAAPPPVDDPGLYQPAGCFVSLHVAATHALRGCVGRMSADRPLVEAVRDAAMGVLEDPRFVSEQVLPAELPQLEIEISILSPLRPASDPMDFDLLNDGIYVTIAGQSGVFLPQVARETGWSKEKLLSRLCAEKLGLSPDAWRDSAAKLEVFSTLILGPVPFEP